MKFSVLLSIYAKESPQFFCQAMDSILCQTKKPDEIVLVKDGPLTAELENEIEYYESSVPILKVVPLPVNVGLGKALNEGLKHCSNDIVARMDTDDVSKPDRFEKQLSVFRTFEDIDVVGAWIEEFHKDPGSPISVRCLPEYHSSIYEYGKSRCPMNHPVVMFRKSSVIAAGGYQHLPLFEDYYLWVRMLMNGAMFYNLQEPLLSFRATEDMYLRRGGWTYAMTELSFLWKIHKMGYVGSVKTLKNSVIRFIVRISPNRFRAFFYRNFLR